MSSKGDLVEIKSTDKSAAGRIGPKVIGGALEPRSANVDKILQNRLNKHKLDKNKNNIDFGRVILYQDRTGGLGKKRGKKTSDTISKIKQAGPVPVKRAAGGSISGAGTDTVPALLTPGEFVINKKSAESFGYGKLGKINKYAKGGAVQRFADGSTGPVTPLTTAGPSPQVTNLIAGIKSLETALVRSKQDNVRTGAAARSATGPGAGKASTAYNNSMRETTRLSKEYNQKQQQLAKLTGQSIRAQTDQIRALGTHTKVVAADTATTSKSTTRKKVAPPQVEGIPTTYREDPRKKVRPQRGQRVGATFAQQGVDPHTPNRQANARQFQGRNFKKFEKAVNERVKALKKAGVSDRNIDLVKKKIKNLFHKKVKEGEKSISTSALLAGSTKALAKAQTLQAAKLAHFNNIRQKGGFGQPGIVPVMKEPKTGGAKQGFFGKGGGVDATGAFFAISALAGQFDILNTATKAVTGLFTSLGGSTSQAEAFSAGLVKTVTQVGILAFALTSLGIKLNKEAIFSAARAEGGGVAASGVAAIGLAAFAAAKLIAVFTDSIFDYAARQKKLTESIKEGDTSKALTQAKSLNTDIGVGNSVKTVGGAGAGAAIGAAIGSIVPVLGTAIGALVGGLIGGLTGYFSGLDKIQIREVKIRSEGFNAIKRSNELEEKKKAVLNDVTKSELTRAAQAATMTLQQVNLNKKATANFKEALKSAKKRSASDEDISAITEELSAAKAAEKQRIDDATVAILGQIKGISSSNLALKTSAEIYSKLTPEQKKLIKELKINSQELKNAYNIQLALNKIKIRELKLAASRLVLEEKLKQSISNITQAGAGLKEFGQKIRGEQTFDVRSSAFARGPRDPGFNNAVLQGGSILGQEDLANDVIGIQGALQAVPAAISASVTALDTEKDLKAQKQKIKQQFDNVFGGINITDADLKEQFDGIKENFNDFLSNTSDPKQALEAFKKAIEELEKAAKEAGESLNIGNKVFEEALSGYSSLLDERNKKESTYLNNLSAYTERFFSRADKITNLRGGTVTRTDIQQRTARSVASLGFAGQNGIQLANQQGNANTLAANMGGGTLTQDQVQRQRDLQNSSMKAGLALKEYNKGLEQQAGIIEQQIEKEKSLTQARRDFSEQFVFGTDEQRQDQLGNLANAQQAARQGNLAGASEDQRSGILSILKQFENAAVFDGRTGAQVQGEIMANELLRAGLINQQEATELRKGGSSKEDRLINGLAAIYGEQNAIEFRVLEHQQIAFNTFETGVDRFGQYVEELGSGRAAQGPASPANPGGSTIPATTRATGGTIYADEGTLVNFKPKGTDTVPAMLTPGEFVVRKSSVDKYGSGMMEQINAGNFADGGIIEPQYHQEPRGRVSRRNKKQKKQEEGPQQSAISAAFDNQRTAGDASKDLQRRTDLVYIENSRAWVQLVDLWQGAIKSLPNISNPEKFKAKFNHLAHLEDLDAAAIRDEGAGLLEDYLRKHKVNPPQKDGRFDTSNTTDLKEQELKVLARTKKTVETYEELAQAVKRKQLEQVNAGAEETVPARDSNRNKKKKGSAFDIDDGFSSTADLREVPLLTPEQADVEDTPLLADTDVGLFFGTQRDILAPVSMPSEDQFTVAGVNTPDIIHKRNIEQLNTKFPSVGLGENNTLVNRLLFDIDRDGLISKEESSGINLAPDVLYNIASGSATDERIANETRVAMYQKAKRFAAFTPEHKAKYLETETEREKKLREGLARQIRREKKAKRAADQKEADVKIQEQMGLDPLSLDAALPDNATEQEKKAAQEKSATQQNKTLNKERATQGKDLYQFLENNLGKDSEALKFYVKRYRDANVKLGQSGEGIVQKFKENEGQFLLTGAANLPNPKLGLDGLFPANPNLSVLSEDERLYFLWAKASGIQNVFEAVMSENQKKFNLRKEAIKGQFPFKEDFITEWGPDSGFSLIANDPLPYNTGGPVGGLPGIDTNPAMLTRGEYVINKQSAQAIGQNNLNRLNSIKGYNEGGPVGYFATGGSSKSSLPSGSMKSSIGLDTKDFFDTVNKLIGGEGFGAFSDIVQKFTDIPRDFTMTVAPYNMTVTLNGAELLAQMMPIIQEEALNAIAGKIEGLKQELRSGDV